MSKTDFEHVRRLLGVYDPAAEMTSDDGTRRATLRAILATHVKVDGRRLTLDRRRAIGFALAAGTVVVVAGVVRWPGGAGSSDDAYAATPPLLAFRASGDRSARDELLAIAERAERSAEPGGRGRYGYVKTQGWYLHTSVRGGIAQSTVVPEIREQWLAKDGSGRIKSMSGTGSTPDNAFDRRLGIGEHRFQWALGTLSTDQETLDRELEVGHPPENGPVERLLAVADLFREQPVRAKVRSAVMRLLADLPGLRNEGTTTDRVGRIGAAVSLDSSHGGLPTRYTLIIDPRTAQLLGQEMMLTTTPGKLNVPIPSVISYTAFLKTGWTDNIETTP